MRPLQVHGQSWATGHFWATFLSMAYQQCLWGIFGSLEPWAILEGSFKYICHFNFDLNPACTTCSCNLFDVMKNELKRCVLEIAGVFAALNPISEPL